MRETALKKTLFCMILLLIAVFSAVFVAERVSTTEASRALSAALDEKSETVLKLTGASTLASATITLIPGDAATPIADKLADFTEYFLLILCVLYAEKYLLSIIGVATFRILVPCVCALLAVGAFWSRGTMQRLALRVALFAVAMFVAIPASLGVSDMVYDSYRQSIDATMEETQALNDKTALLSEAGEDKGLIASVLESISESASGLADKAAGLLNHYVESLAVLIVTSCVIPLLAMVFFVWLIRLLTGLDLRGVIPPRRGAARGRGGEERT
ncbi:MAG: hypothetical protein K6G54_01345 [Oscillospiraceae bacterium]|nr:hypothetical protein [Oscillospiraceae bacterium]